MDADELLGMPEAKLDRHPRADVAAMRAEPLVAEAVRHQAGPHVGDGRLQERLGKRVGEAVARHRRDHDVERVLGAPSVAGGIGQERQQVEVLDERAREAVREHEWQRRRPVAGLVEEVDPQPVDLGAVVRKTVDFLLLLAPVELGPAREQGAQVLHIGPVLPA